MVKIKKISKKKLLILILIVIVSVGGAYIAIISFTNKNNTQNQTKPEDISSGIKIESSVDIKSQLENTIDQDKKDRLYNDLITSLQLEGDLDGAIKVAIEYSDIVKTADSYGLLAGLYGQKGERLLAKNNYAKAVDLSEKTDLDQRSPYSYYYEKLQTFKDLE